MAWIMDETAGRPTNTEFIPIPDRPFVNDSPYTMWRIVPGQHNSKPFIPLMPKVPKYDPEGGQTYYIGDTPVVALYIGDTPVEALL